MPHGSVCSSMIFCRSSLRRSRSESSGSSRRGRGRSAAWSGRSARWRARKPRLRDRARRVDDPEVQTAATRAGTLSRVITSCGGMVSVTVRSWTRTMRSTSGISSTRPGPLTGEQAAEAEHDRALVLAQHPQADGPRTRGDDGDDGDDGGHGAPSVRSARPSGCGPRASAAVDDHAQARGRRSAGEVGRMRAQVAGQPACGQRAPTSRTPSRRADSAGRWWRTTPKRTISDASADQDQRQAAVEAPGLGVRPGVQRTDDLAAAFGVGARALARAAVADVGPGPVAHEPALVVGLVGPQVLALGAVPGVGVLVVGEACGPVAQRAAVGVGGQPLEDERDGDQETRHSRRRGAPRRSRQPFAAVASSPSCAARPLAAASSVKRMSPARRV